MAEDSALSGRVGATKWTSSSCRGAGIFSMLSTERQPEKERTMIGLLRSKQRSDPCITRSAHSNHMDTRVSIYGGTCRTEYPGVKAPGTAEQDTFVVYFKLDNSSRAELGLPWLRDI